MSVRRNAKKSRKAAEEFSFTAEDFLTLLESQNGLCALTGVELTPMNAEVELIEPFKQQGRANIDNFYLVDRRLSPLARNLSKKEIAELAGEILAWQNKGNRGK